MIKRFLALLTVGGRVFVFAICGFISLYVLLSGYESIYLRPVPLVATITPVNLTSLSSSYQLDPASGQNPKLYGYFGQPSTLILPQRSLRLDIVPALREGADGPWLARTETMHLLIPGRPRNGNIGILLLYCRSSYRTITETNLPQPGQNVFMTTNQAWQYVYRVQASAVIPDNQPYVISDDGTTGKLIILCDDASQQLDEIVVADAVSVEGVTQ